MLPIIKEIKQKLRTARGFTMVELMVVLLILGILAALAGTGLIAYVRLARFEHNESGARTVFQTAQIALTRKDTSGDMDTFLTELREVGTLGDHFSAGRNWPAAGRRRTPFSAPSRGGTKSVRPPVHRISAG